MPMQMNPFTRPNMMRPQGGGVKSTLANYRRQYMEAARAPARNPAQMKMKNSMMSELGKMIKNLEGMMVRPTRGTGR